MARALRGITGVGQEVDNGVFNLTSTGLEDIFVNKLRTTYLVTAPMIFHNAAP